MLKRRRVTHPVKSPFANPKAVAQQHLAGEADINQIVARARRGISPTNVRSGGVFADVSSMPSDLTDAFDRVEHAMDLFSRLPAKAREELGNDPRRLVHANLDFFKRHGLAAPEAQPESSQAAPKGAGEGSPAKASKKPGKAAAAASNTDSDEGDQE